MNNKNIKKIPLFWRILIVINIFSLIWSYGFAQDLGIYYFIICIITFIVLLLYLIVKKNAIGFILSILYVIKFLYLINPSNIYCEDGSGCAIAFLWFLIFIPIAITHLVFGILVFRKTK